LSSIDSNILRELGNTSTEGKSDIIIKKSRFQTNNQRANITAIKYQKEIANRRKKVNNLLMKGYS
jgi:hypothetical protein